MNIAPGIPYQDVLFSNEVNYYVVQLTPDIAK